MRLSTDIVNLGTHLLNIRTGDLFEIDESGERALELLREGIVKQNETTQFMIDNDIVVEPARNPSRDFFHLQWHLLNDCNLRCRHCYDWKEKVRTLSFEEMLNTIDNYVLFLKRMGMDGEISLTGGEPLMFKRIGELIEYIKSRDVFISLYILTNGTIMNDLFIELFSGYNIGVQVSIDGTEDKHDEIRGKGNYHRSIRTLERLLRANIDTAVHYVIMKRNVSVVREFLEEMRKIGIDKIHFSRLVPIGPGAKEKMLSPEELREIMEEIAEYQKNTSMHVIATRPIWTLVGGGGICPVGYKTLTIDANGQYLPCRRLPIPLGDTRRDSFFKIWFCSPLLQKMREREKYIKICGTCSNANVCGGCRGIAYAVTGDPFAPDPNCWLNNREMTL